ncbi:pyridoxine 5'-phosphate oxidase C-terminal domain-containing protein, partial [Pseudomonas aeruginosa]|uniref:pyridoxine 5'-phosphate oxidase C-terminal domain-containing protein n=1 Tax=Pseudomonas aeruginosa TaxID=287 RepID=UPI002ABE479C
DHRSPFPGVRGAAGEPHGGAAQLAGTRPPGYCLFELCLESVEFWGNGTERLHERLRYDRDEGGWKHRYLQP